MATNIWYLQYSALIREGVRVEKLAIYEDEHRINADSVVIASWVIQGGPQTADILTHGLTRVYIDVSTSDFQSLIYACSGFFCMPMIHHQ